MTEDNLAKNRESGNEEDEPQLWHLPDRGWPVTGRGGGASLLPCTPAGVTGSDNEDGRAVTLKETEGEMSVLKLTGVAAVCGTRQRNKINGLLQSLTE